MLYITLKQMLLSAKNNCILVNGVTPFFAVLWAVLKYENVIVRFPLALLLWRTWINSVAWFSLKFT